MGCVRPGRVQSRWSGGERDDGGGGEGHAVGPAGTLRSGSASSVPE